MFALSTLMSSVQIYNVKRGKLGDINLQYVEVVKLYEIIYAIVH